MIVNIFFFISLSASVALAVCLAVLLIERLQINWTNQNRIGISFLYPVLLSVLLTALIIFDTQPRVLDSINLVSGNVKTLEIAAQDLEIKGNRVIINGKSYFLSPLFKQLETNKRYRLSFTPRTRMIISSDEIKSLPEITQDQPAESKPKNE